MPSGFRTMIINTQERAVSTDINRLQDFEGFDLAEMMRYLINVSSGDDDANLGVITQYSTLATPLRAEIINGYLVQPQQGLGVLDLLVTDGVLFGIAPDGSPDESNYKFVKDPGLPSIGFLSMTPNSSGSPRVDVIECQIAEYVSETDNRDIFNPLTGLFSAVNVDKVRQGKLNYRVRLGTPGGGYPGGAMGWLPLAVAHVPDGVSDNDGMIFWDVRPLINDRLFNVTNLSIVNPVMQRAHVNASDLTQVSGYVEALFLDRRIGGHLKSGSGFSDLLSIDLTDPVNQDPGVSFAIGTFQYLYLVFPFGLPRWARYTAGAPRLPHAPRGIPVLSSNVPNNAGRRIINLPTSTGMLGQAGEGYCIGSQYVDFTGTSRGWYGDNQGYRWVTISVDEDPKQIAGVVLSTGVGGVEGGTWTFHTGTQFPAHARSILVEFRWQLPLINPTSVLNGTANYYVKVFAPNGGPAIALSSVESMFFPSHGVIGATNTFFCRFSTWVDLAVPENPANTFTVVMQAFTDHDAFDNGATGIPVATTPVARIIGWRF